MEHSLRHHVGAHGEEGRWQVLLITATDDIAPGVAPWNDSQIIVSQYIVSQVLSRSSKEILPAGLVSTVRSDSRNLKSGS